MKKLRSLAVVLAAAVVFMTSYSLILPAITMEASVAESEPGIELDVPDTDTASSAETEAAFTEEELTPENIEAESSNNEVNTEELSGTEETDVSETPEISAAQETVEITEPTESPEIAETPEAAEPTEAAEAAASDEHPGSVEAADEKDTNDAKETAAASDDKEKDKKVNNDEDKSKEMPAMTFRAALYKNEDKASAPGYAEGEEPPVPEEDPAVKEEREKNLLVKVAASAEEGIFPAGTTMEIRDVTEQNDISEKIDSAVEGYVKNYQAIDITFYDKDGKKIEPKKEIKVTITSAIVKQTENPVLVHVPDKGAAEVIEPIDEEKLDEKPAEDEMIFESDSFSVYAVVETILEKTVITADGEKYKISVIYGPDAMIPDGAELEVTEILPEFDYNPEEGIPAYHSYLAAAEEVLGFEIGSVTYARLFDISIVKDGDIVEPAEGVEVSVKIELEDQENAANSQVVHFGAQTEIMDTRVEGAAISFETTSFSVYTVVEVPEPESLPYQQALEVEELGATDSGNNKGFLLSVTKNNSQNTFYFMDTINNNAIRKTSANDIESASVWYFEKVEGTDNQFYLYLDNGDGTRTYMNMSNNGNMSLSDTQGTAFTVELYNNQSSRFYIYYQVGNSKYGLNMSQGENGPGFKGWTGKDDGSRIVLTYPPGPIEDDPAGLDGMTYGLLNYKSGTTATAVMAEGKNNDTRRVAKELHVKTDPLDYGALYVAKDSEITMWTFHNIEEDRYYITAEVEGQTKYLRVTSSEVNLVDEPDEYCELHVMQGRGTYKGKIRIHNKDNYSPNLYNGKPGDGFGSWNDSGPNEWLNLAELSELTEEDFTPYSAYKVSVSDTEHVPNGAEVVVYTRVWNDDIKAYEFFAIDHTGNLVQCFESGDTIEWIGLNINNLLWDFTEYYYENTDEPNYYYDLQNQYSGKYFGPRIESTELLSDSPVGVNLNGRRYENYYTTILAWDDPYYQYAGYKIENGRLVSCPLYEAEDFYFAIMEPITEHEPDDELTTANTVNNNDYGITMKMIDYNGTKTNQGIYDKTQTDVIGSTGDKQGLVTPYLESNGYPVAVDTGISLSQLYNGAEEVNHLFLESIYQQSGYFEFNSTQNFAHLEPDGNFTLYNELGTMEKSGASKEHGQFMPYNDLVPGEYSSLFKNMTDELDQPLSDDDPRKGEQLYAIPVDSNDPNDANFHFGMEMEASFTQTADGLDAWGHDIIFEFAGDDDMWLYVDGILILDLGGVHAANTGKVNFRTGEVTMKRRDKNVPDTNLRTLFEESYRAQYPEAADAEVEEWLDGIFKDGTSVFKDYTSHTMRMIYMERGAGASNLHMRFNLASVKPGTIVLSKKLSGTESETNDLLEFPYQVFYKSTTDGETFWYPLTEKTGDVYNATYKDSTKPVAYMEEFTMPSGLTYEHVFFLKPGEAAVFDLPDDATVYYIVECGINAEAYETVSANGTVLEGIPTAVEGRMDYATSEATLTERPEVDYDNHAKPGAVGTLTIKKKLYDSDGIDTLHYDAATGEKEDKSIFNFRLYLGNEYADPDNLPLANMYSYHVKDRYDNYCTWNAQEQKFDSLGITDYETLLASGQLRAATFTTSMNGSITKIPSDYSVEIRDLIVGTGWKVEERDYEIPRGYTLRLEDGYQRTDTDHLINNQTEPISGTMTLDDDNQHILVSNQKGWGLTVNKVWTDKDFMAMHDDIYYAVYTKHTTGEGNNQTETYELIEHTLRQMHSPTTSLYYFFGNLQSGIPFRDYTIFEVRVNVPEGYELFADAADNGEVKARNLNEPYDVITLTDAAIVRITEDEGDYLVIGGRPVGGEYRADAYTYTVKYEQGEETTQNENVRTDTVTNSRPGIKIYKTDWEGEPLADTYFTLKDSEGDNVAATSYHSREEDGLVTIAYLNAGTYSLDEIVVPKGYIGMEQTLSITLDGENNVTASGLPESMYDLETELDPDDDMIAYITIKNRTADLQTVKIDAVTQEPIAGVQFALHRQVIDKDGNPIKDTHPMEGYESLVTNEDGILEEISLDLPAGTYYLHETRPVQGYDPLEKDICFTIGRDGTVTINSEEHTGWLQKTDDGNGHVSYTLTIYNGKMKNVQLKKISAGTEIVLENVGFELYRASDFDTDGQLDPEAEAMLSGDTDENGILSLGALAIGEYRLVETHTVDGYNLLDEPVKVFVNANNVTAIQGGNAAEVTQLDNGTWQITVWNNPGVSLPSAGGIGTHLFYIIGAILVLGAGIVLAVRRRLA